MENLEGKECHKCGEFKERSAFHQNYRMKDGLQSSCKVCLRAYNRNRYQPKFRRHSEVSTLNSRRCSVCKTWKPLDQFEWQKNKNCWRSECKPCKATYTRKWKKLKPSGYYSKYYKKVDGKPKTKRVDGKPKTKRSVETIRLWWRLKRQKRRVAIQENGGCFTSHEWKTLCEKYDNRCLACGIKSFLTIDHIRPVVLGGTNDITNIQPLCKRCNSKKGGKIIDYRPPIL